MKKIIICLLALFAAFTPRSFGQNQKELIVWVAPFEVRAGFSGTDAETITELFMDELAKFKTLKVVDQTKGAFANITSRMQFETSDWSDDNKVAAFGKANNANAIVRGQMMKLGNQLIITARVLDVNTTQILAPSRMELNNAGEVLGKLPAFAKSIADNLPKPPPPPLADPFAGRWRSTVNSNNETLICVLSFKGNGTIEVEQYGVNTVTRRFGGLTYTNTVKKGRGSGSYSFRAGSGNTVIADISLTLLSVPGVFEAITVQGTLNASQPNTFQTQMGCEYYVAGDSQRVEDYYETFNKL